jgi:HK97 family phage major capsid protein
MSENVSRRPESFPVSAELERAIDVATSRASPMRGIAKVVVGSAAGHRVMTAKGEVSPSYGEVFASPAASEAMLDDAAFDAEKWLADEIGSEFGCVESEAFVVGNGVNKPKGFLAAPVSREADATRAGGTLQYLPSGRDGDFDGIPEDRLIDLTQALQAEYRRRACWVMNSMTLARIRRIKTEEGAPLWAPSLAGGQPSILLGYPVIEVTDMPDIAANSLAIAFGDFGSGYLIAERGPTQIVRDPFTKKPFVLFYATKRIGGAVSDWNALKLMRFSKN